MQNKIALIADIEALILGSRFLNFEDKKKLLYKVPQLTEEQLHALKNILLQEIEEWKRIDAMEKKAWNGLALSLNSLVAHS